jgi:S-adenosylmethionine uptake transporter
MSQRNVSTAVPFAVACLGIALFSAMDAAMKGLSITLGAYSAMLWRQAIGGTLSAGPYFLMRKGWPSRKAFRVHLLRGLVGSIMAVSFFYGIARVPLAEGIALSFIAPLIALYLAAALLGETVGRHTIVASLFGVAGVAVLLAARIGSGDGARQIDGVIAIFISAVFYAYNIILMRQQALVASPSEVAFFQNVTAGGFLLIALPVVLLVAPPLFSVPDLRDWPMLILAAVLAVASLYLLSWAYARAEAQVLVPVEYTAFVWAAIMGAIFYAEALTWTTAGGAALIVTGCIVAARGRHTVVSPAEAAL